MHAWASRVGRIRPFIVMELLNRARELEAQGKKIIHLEIGEPDFQTHESIVRAGLNAIAAGQIRYVPAGGLPQLRQAIAAFYQRRYGVGIAAERIFLTPGGSGAFLLALALLLEPGKRVLMTDPGYPCNPNFVYLFGGVPEAIPVTAATDFHLTAKLVRQHWQPDTAGVWLASPANPTGTVIEPGELAAICQVVAEKGGFVLSDEIYHGLEYGTRCLSALEVSDEVFVANSFSKYFGMTGWRLGWLVVPKVYVEAAERIVQNIFISASVHAQYAALAAFDPQTLEVLEDRRRKFEARRDFLYDSLSMMGFRIEVKPRGAFYLYADCSRLTLDSYRFAWDLLEQAGVAVTPGCDFGRVRASSYIRFAYTIDFDGLQEGIERIRNFIGRAGKTVPA